MSVHYWNMSITFRKISDPDPVVETTTQLLRQRLTNGERVLWLVAGGSVVPLVVAVAQGLLRDQVPLANLVVTQTDERYGEVGHPDSNWQQLHNAGFTLPGAQLEPVIKGKDMQATSQDFAYFLDQEFAKADYKVALMGIGPDAHLSGILPGSSAVMAEGLTHAYKVGGYQRVTTTLTALRLLDEAVVYAVGEAKHQALSNLQEADASLVEQPDQILKELNHVTIFNDHIGDEL